MSKSSRDNRLVAGVGVMDIGHTVTAGGKIICPFYDRWQGMLNRVYREPVQGRYVGCSVAEEWHTFSNFKAWMEKQDWEGKDLDKDLKVVGNKVYGPDTCMFIPRELNAYIAHCKPQEGVFLTGVYYTRGLFVSEVMSDGVRHRREFGTELEAHKDWCVRKAQDMRAKVSLCEGDEEAEGCLLRNADLLESGHYTTDKMVTDALIRQVVSLQKAEELNRMASKAYWKDQLEVKYPIKHTTHAKQVKEGSVMVWYKSQWQWDHYNKPKHVFEVFTVVDAEGNEVSGTVSELCRHFERESSAVRARVELQGMNLQDALTKRPKRIRKYVLDGEVMGKKYVCERLGVCPRLASSGSYPDFFVFLQEKGVLEGHTLEEVW